MGWFLWSGRCRRWPSRCATVTRRQVAVDRTVLTRAGLVQAWKNRGKDKGEEEQMEKFDNPMEANDE